MCQPKPGTRCANDACQSYTDTLSSYNDSYPDGPAVSALGPAETSLFGKVRSVLSGDAARKARWREVEQMRTDREARTREAQQRRLAALERTAARQDAVAASATTWRSARADEKTFTREVVHGV